MSRTFKDKPYKLKHEPWDMDRARIEGTWYSIDLPTTKTKKRKEVDTEDHWMTTPGWWIHMKHTKPERRISNMKVATIADLEDADIPNLHKMSHWYFWQKNLDLIYELLCCIIYKSSRIRDQ